MNAKKKSGDRVDAKAKAEINDVDQSAAEQKAAEAELTTLIEKFAPASLPLVVDMRKTLRKRLPTAHEVVYEYREWFVISYSPSGNGYEGILAIRGDANGIKLYFNHGKDLPDPENLLKGTSQTRFIDVDSVSVLARPAVERLIGEAITRNRVPFRTDGDGSVTRSASTKRKAKRA